MNIENKNKTTIQVSVETRNKLLKFGYMGETFDDAINRLIFMANNGKIADKEVKTNKEIARSM